MTMEANMASAQRFVDEVVNAGNFAAIDALGTRSREPLGAARRSAHP